METGRATLSRTGDTATVNLAINIKWLLTLSQLTRILVDKIVQDENLLSFLAEDDMEFIWDLSQRSGSSFEITGTFNRTSYSVERSS